MKRSIIAAISILFMAVACLAEISGERPVSSPAYEPSRGYQYNARGASDGHGFLVAWIDNFRSHTYRSNARMYATRITESGQVLDPLGIRIPTITSALSGLNVVYLGDSYLICWSEGDISAPGVMGVRIKSDGTLLDPTPRIFAERGSIFGGGIASDGNRAVIVYTGAAGSLMTVVLDRDANVAAGPKPLTNPAGPVGETAIIASNGHGFLSFTAPLMQTTPPCSMRVEPPYQPHSRLPATLSITVSWSPTATATWQSVCMKPVATETPPHNTLVQTARCWRRRRFPLRT